MVRIQCAHIYHGTQGNGGLYLDEIYEVLKAKGFTQEIYVSYYFPFNYGKKYFFKYTDLLGGMRKGTFRLLLRYIELVIGLCRTFYSLLRLQPYVVNYSVISNLYLPEKLFIKALKFFIRSKIVFTCHDVIPFSEKQDDVEHLVKKRRELFRMADYYIVHTVQSRAELIKYYGCKSDNILFYRFPIMDLSKLPNIKIVQGIEKNIDFLFIGHLRKEKGIDFLISAWKVYFETYKRYDVKLFIAGNPPRNKSLDIVDLAKYNIFVCDKYLTDQEYYDLISSARYVILPYQRGTNSGVISTVKALGTNVLCTDIQMFANNPLVNAEELFCVDNVESFIKSVVKLVESVNLKDNSEQLKSYRTKFNLEVESTYHNLLS